MFLKFVLPFITLLGACATLPGQGPNSVDIEQNETDATSINSFAVVDLSPNVISNIGKTQRTAIGRIFGDSGNKAGSRRIGIGDKLVVQIWETSPDGIFASASSKSSEFSVVVDNSGSIYIPYVDKISVINLDVDAVRTQIAASLDGKTVDPEVIVTLDDNGVHSVSVVGDASNPGQYGIAPNGMRLLDAIALAGGTSNASFDMEVSLLRRGKIAAARLDDVVGYDVNNVWLMPRDTIQLFYRPRSFTAFGAVNVSKQHVFETETVSLAEALGQVGGLSYNLAAKGGVFVFRFETEKQSHNIGADAPKQKFSQGIPVIYRLDFSTPEAFFLAQAFMLDDKDIVYVALAPAVEFNKFIKFILSPFLLIREKTS
jgi:polysaccharide export outer membrane protein